MRADVACTAGTLAFGYDHQPPYARREVDEAATILLIWSWPCRTSAQHTGIGSTRRRSAARARVYDRGQLRDRARPRARAAHRRERSSDYVTSGFYNGTIFHRVVAGFVAQAGGYTADFKQKANDRHGVQRIRQRPQQPARDGRLRTHERPAFRHEPVLHQPGRQRRSEPAADALGLRGVRQGRRGHGQSSTRSVIARPAPAVRSTAACPSSRSRSRRIELLH